VTVVDKPKVSVLFWEERTQGSPWHDEVVDQVAEALSEGGHKVSLIGISDDLRELLDKLDDQHPELVFNLCERFAGRMRFPLFVKPLCGDTSLGIDDSSLVTEYTKLIERVGFIQTQLKLPALVEEYIEGREFYVSILGNDPGEVLPVMELDFAKLPSGYPRIYGHDAKSDESSVQYGAVNAVVATDLTPEIRARITMVGREAAFPLAALQSGMGYTTSDQSYC
jgi:D-alanine-D-alanine ligase-like ATP-grasp enzyme